MGESSAQVKKKVTSSTELHESFTFISKSLPVNEPEILIRDNQLENLLTANLFPSVLAMTLLLQKTSNCQHLLPVMMEVNCYP